MEETHQWAQQVTAQIPEIPDYPTACAEPDAVDDFLPPDLRQPGRDEIAGMIMPYHQPLIIDHEVRACAQCGSYRKWVVISTADEIWLHCPNGHYNHEPALDAAWYNRTSGPVTKSHTTLEDALKDLGH